MCFYQNNLSEHKISIDLFEAEFDAYSTSFFMIILENEIWSSLNDYFDL